MLATPPSSPQARRRSSLSSAPASPTTTGAYVPPSRRLSGAVRPAKLDLNHAALSPLAPISPRSPGRFERRATWGTFTPPSSPTVELRSPSSRRTSLESSSDVDWVDKCIPRDLAWRERQGGCLGRSGSASLSVYGDSFVGPMTHFVHHSMIHKWKGASAKGLNNSESTLQIGEELLEWLDYHMNPPPSSYSSPTYQPALRHGLLIFGNVDLQVNYLFQLLTRPLLPELNLSAPLTEDSPWALGPIPFVTERVNEYATFLLQIVNGPIGKSLASVEANPVLRWKHKILVSSAILPFVADAELDRIVQKYIVRFRREHEEKLDVEEEGYAAGDEATSPQAEGLSFFDGVLPSLDSDSDSSTPLPIFHFDDFTPSSAPPLTLEDLCTSPSPPLSPSTPFIDYVHPEFITTISDLLTHDPPLCTYAVRLAMTREWNAQLKSFCAQHPDILRFVDINSAMVDSQDRVRVEEFGDPIDATNIHPCWERTVSLWLEELSKAGMDTSEVDLSHIEHALAEYKVGKMERVLGRGHQVREWGRHEE